MTFADRCSCDMLLAPHVYLFYFPHPVEILFNPHQQTGQIACCPSNSTTVFEVATVCDQRLTVG